MDTHARKQEEGCKVRRQQNEKNLSALEEKDAHGKRNPCDDDKAQPIGKPGAQGRGGTGKNLEAIEKEESRNGKERQACPALERQPCGGGGQFEPAGDQEVEKESRSRSAKGDAERNRGELSRRGKVNEDEREAEEKEKAGEIAESILEV